MPGFGPKPWATAYREFLRSPEWERYADAVRTRHRWSCWFCGEHAHAAHHRSYRYGLMPPASSGPIYDIVVLACEECHTAWHTFDLATLRNRMLRGSRVVRE